MPKREAISSLHRTKALLIRAFDLQTSPGRILALEGLRGFAALLVFLVHFHGLFAVFLAPHSFVRKASRFAGSLGNTGVDLFFLLSGFLMYGIVLNKAPAFGSYLYRRVKRLYPVFIAVLAIYLALSRIIPQESRLPIPLGRAGLYVLANLAMLPGMLPIRPLVTVAWSLSCEWFFYLLLPLSIWGLRMRRWRAKARVGLVLLLCAIYYGLCMAHFGSHSRLIMFGSGICLWECANNCTAASRLPSWGEYAAIFAMAASLSVAGLANIQSPSSMLSPATFPGLLGPLLFVSMFFFVLYVLQHDGILRTLFSRDWLRAIGNMSYSYYLIHGLALHGVQWAMRRLTPGRLLPLALFLALTCVSLLVTLAAAAWLFLTIEKPFSLSKRIPAGEQCRPSDASEDSSQNRRSVPSTTAVNAVMDDSAQDFAAP